MEVHHHPDLHHQKRKFKEYFLEFLMIFLAVTMGFIAENVREYFSDNAKEKEYVSSMIRNLRDDSTNLTNTILENKDKLRKLDTLMSLSSRNIFDTLTRKLLYQYTAESIGFYSKFESNDATMLQLTNSGGLRFIRRSHVADSIAKYDIEMKAIYQAGDIYTNATNLGILATHDLFDYTVFHDKGYFKDGAFTKKLLPLLSVDNSKLKSFYNKVDFEMGATENYIKNLQSRLPFTIALIRFLQEKYHLENE
jgi:hypothetical protein